MKRTLSIVSIGLLVGSASADEISWKPSAPLWKGFSFTGRVVDAGPAPMWCGPKAPEPFAKLGIPLRPVSESLPQPRELPQTVTTNEGPKLLPASAVIEKEDGRQKDSGQKNGR